MASTSPPLRTRGCMSASIFPARQSVEIGIVKPRPVMADGRIGCPAGSLSRTPRRGDIVERTSMVTMRIATLWVLLLASGCATTHGGEVAYADLPAAVRECRDGRLAREDLMREFRDYQERLDRRKRDLMDEWQQIEASRARGENVGARQAAFQKQMVAVHDEYLSLQKDLTDAEQRRADQIRAHLRKILRDVAQARGISVVSDADAPLGDGHRYVNLTEDVIRAANAAPNPSASSAGAGRP